MGIKYSLWDYQIFAKDHQDKSAYLPPAAPISSTQNGFHINASGFRVCRNLEQVERFIAYLGLFVVCNGTPMSVIKVISGARSSTILDMASAIRNIWGVDIEIVDGKIQMRGMGEFLNSDPSWTIKFAFPTGYVRCRTRLYQLF